MTFPHQDPEWSQLLRIVADTVGRSIALVEKDYWVTHTLWAIAEQGFEVWFKGGTSLSKGYDLIERFSEDIDLQLESGTSGLTDPVLSWKNMKKGKVERDEWFNAIADTLDIPDCTVTRDLAGSDPGVRGAAYQVEYPALHGGSLTGAMRPYVLLEVGRARVTPFRSLDLSSWVHDELEGRGMLGEYQDNRPRQVRTIHPWATCLEKIEAIAKKFGRGDDASWFVRHYEDAARILDARDRLPPLDDGLPQLVVDLKERDRKVMPQPGDPAFNPDGSSRWDEVQDAWADIGPMFWGPRISLKDASSTIRTFLGKLL